MLKLEDEVDIFVVCYLCECWQNDYSVLLMTQNVINSQEMLSNWIKILVFKLKLIVIVNPGRENKRFKC